MSDNAYMLRALELAALGEGRVSPNPMVGCVIVHEDRIIGEGWHRQYGGPHAEVNAVNSVKDISLLSQATVYVTLEPCAHFGKTPPCADLLIHHEVKKVVICNTDPFPLVAGKGIEKLKAAGITVETGLLDDKGRFLNRRFFRSVETGRPYVILKWAETADGFIAGKGGSPVKITNPVSDVLVHRWRSEEDAIMIGTNTARNDNPSLNVRNWEGKNPVRVVTDRHLTLDPSLKIFTDGQKTLIMNEVSDKEEGPCHFIRISPASGAEQLTEILQQLHLRGVRSVLVEGGAILADHFMSAMLFDEIRILKSGAVIGSGINAPRLPSGIALREEKDLAGDNLRIFLR